MPTNNIATAVPSSDLSVDEASLARRLQMAQMLQNQALSAPPNETIGGYTVKQSPLQGMARMLQAYAANNLQEKADQQQKALVSEQNRRLADTITAFQSTKDPSVLLKHPQTMAAGLQIMEKQAENQPWGKVDAKDYDPASVAAFAKSNDYSVLRPRVKMENVNGVWQNPYAQPDNAIAPQNPNEPFYMGPNGPVANIPYQRFAIQKATAGANNVSVNTAEKPFLSELGKGAAGEVLSGFNQAQQATQTLANIAQIRSGMNKAITGPGANARITLAQIGEAMGVNGKDTTEKLTNTRNVIQGLARQELAAAGQMKGQGQITEAERGILRRAESGDVSSLTVPELNVMVGAMERIANYRIQSHNQNVQRLKGDPNAAPMVQYLTVNAPPGVPSAPVQGGNKQITVDY